MIYSWAKNLGEPINAIMYDYSWQNLVMYSAATPSYDDEESIDEKYDERFDACNPDNFKNKIFDGKIVS